MRPTLFTVTASVAKQSRDWVERLAGFTKIASSPRFLQ
jgi:hypothetical protein